MVSGRVLVGRGSGTRKKEAILVSVFSAEEDERHRSAYSRSWWLLLQQSRVGEEETLQQEPGKRKQFQFQS